MVDGGCVGCGEREVMVGVVSVLLKMKDCFRGYCCEKVAVLSNIQYSLTSERIKCCDTPMRTGRDIITRDDG